MENLLLEIVSVGIDGLRKHPTARIVVLAVPAILAVLLVAEARLGRDSLLGAFGAPLFVISGFAFLAAALSFTSFDASVGRGGLGSELDSLRQERAAIQRRLAEPSANGKERDDLFDTIQLSLNQVTEYYTINKGQALNSLRLSVFAVVVGMFTLVGGIWLYYLREPRDIRLATLLAVASVFAQSVGAAYFYLSNKSLSRLNLFHTKLVGVQDTMLAIRLTESLPEPKAAQMKQQVIEALLDRRSEAAINWGDTPTERPRAHKQPKLPNGEADASLHGAMSAALNRPSAPLVIWADAPAEKARAHKQPKLPNGDADAPSTGSTSVALNRRPEPTAVSGDSPAGKARAQKQPKLPNG